MGRLLRQFADVRRNEVEPSILFFGFWFIVILVFQVLRPLKKGLFVEALGADTELYAKLANIAVAAVLVIAFTALYNRLGSRRTIVVLCALLIAALLAFAWIFASQRGSHAATWAFYLFGDAWSTLWVTTFWAYLNEMTATEQAKRLYGFIGGGGVLGGFVGNFAVWQLVRPWGTQNLLVLSAAMTLIVALIVWRTEMLSVKPGAAIGRRRQEVVAKPKAGGNPVIEGARLVSSSRYLLAITAIVFLYEIVSQIFDYQFSKASEAVEGAGATQAFFGQVFTFGGILSVVVQFFVVSFVMRRLGLKTALLVLPVAMALSASVYMTVPVLLTASLLYISDSGFSYSMNQTARETLYVPTPEDVKYKARAFTNMFVQRFGKGAAILMALGLGAFPLRLLSVLALVVIGIWAALALYAGKRFDAATAKVAEPGRERETVAL
ncbi:MAG: Npt1/Npt2 family nucleotide transporter [Bryobacteraceae bacterium]|nr:Npt1/Npt2 family nucleotide transporter [Bryobacteraceae bacterium]